MRRREAAPGWRGGLLAGAAIAGGIVLTGLGAAALRRRIGPGTAPRGPGVADQRARVEPRRAQRINGLTVPRSRVSPVRLQRGLAALQLVARGGMRYAGSAPRLFTAAGEHPPHLRPHPPLHTA